MGTSRTIRHALFLYTDADGGTQYAQRGQTVELNDDDLARGEKHGAFVTDDAQLIPPPPSEEALFTGTPQPSDDPDTPTDWITTNDPGSFPASGSDEDQQRWVSEHTVAEVLELVRTHPEHGEALLAAEEASDQPRSTLTSNLESLLGAS